MEHLDVIIVGAGISGISAAVHLGKACPERSVGILEGRENIGGTWDLFKYPGIRSDSDMHTLGFSFKPWRAEKSIADGPAIMHYLDETVDEYQLQDSIRFSHKVVAADWSSADARWVLTVDQGGAQKQMSCNFLFMCSGYYSYDQPYDAQIPGIESFAGDVVHPQFWPESLDYRGKRVMVIGSGATAVTIVPSMAQGGAHVTMLQRSPTYMVARPDQDAIANFLRKVLPDSWAYALTRFKNVGLQNFFYKRARKAPTSRACTRTWRASRGARSRRAKPRRARRSRARASASAACRRSTPRCPASATRSPSRSASTRRRCAWPPRASAVRGVRRVRREPWPAPRGRPRPPRRPSLKP